MIASPSQSFESESASDPLFVAARRQLVAPAPAQTRSLLYLGLFVLFVWTQLDGLKSLSGIALLIAVLLFHEGGHALGMRLFGYRDVRMFFIPFFGAAVQGRPRGAVAWKHAVVS